MIISNNKAEFFNPTNNNFGQLRTPGSTPMGLNETFLAFKPTSVCKRAGFLRVTVSGTIRTVVPNMKFDLYMEFVKHNIHSFGLPIVLEKVAPVGTSCFRYSVDIPVGLAGDSENNQTVASLQFNDTSSVLNFGAYIGADADEVYYALFKYGVQRDELPISPGDIRVLTVVSEYMEN